ncbi:MAG: hypothetical protein CM15mP126_7540 [Gammaproteobacteria bacterium]|nr:MAG: hypothetical protein CM15mP126_7540 [Gammaproteobacteria bacterium]
MTASQLMTGMGGWPLNVITLPDGSPIYAEHIILHHNGMIF